jgi:SAM-dependent MidA family methyltransferase
VTAPTASAWYGKVIARLVHRIALATGPLDLVDAASGDGSLLAAVVSELPAHTRKNIRVTSVERSPAMRSVQRGRFRGSSDGSVQLKRSIDEIGDSDRPLVVHASELYDAMPVHRVIQRETGLHELVVGADPSGLRWSERPADDRLVGYFESHEVTLVPDQIAEVNLDAQRFHAELLRAARRGGLALVLDYGYTASRLYNPRGRAGGSLACYRGHRLVQDPLADPGLQDITAHVNWDDLRRAAADGDWREIGLWPLAEFLVRAGLAEVADDEGLGVNARLDARTVTERQEIKRLLDPDGMGSDLKMLAQGRGMVAEVATQILETCGRGGR